MALPLARSGRSTELVRRPVPTTIELLTAHYFPPQPDTIVSRNHRAEALVGRHVVALRAELDQLRAHHHAAGQRIAAAALAGDEAAIDTIAAAAADEAATITRLDATLTALTSAYNALGQTASRAARTDPTYVAWSARCRQIGADWRAAQMSGGGGDYDERAVLRDRAVRGFAAELAARLDDEMAATARR